MKRILLLSAGWLTFIIGTIGIVLPVLPTTPFYLLAAICFSASSRKAYNFLVNSKYFGVYIDNYQNKTGVPKAAKIRAIITLWIGLIISIFLVKKTIVTIILLFVGTCVTVHISSLKSRES
ncbi:MAG: YbaN family protein [Anaerovoracaceae bacterium]|jgi:uncharacterized membrane protein YbaN (DUF454 family)